MNTLDHIVQQKMLEVNERISLYPVELLKRTIYFHSPAVSLKTYLQRDDKSGIIAEIKRQSPSKGILNPYISIEKTSIGYMQAGASALSILTDQRFFGGSSADLTMARTFNYCPILRKDFILHEYQIIESKSIGADAILLIAAILSKEDIIRFTDLAHALSLEVVLELHAVEELDKLYEQVDVVGVNNRNLKTMAIDVSQSIRMSRLLPQGLVKISESGIETPETIKMLREYGYQGFLIGSHFMSHPKPHHACRNFIAQLKSRTPLNYTPSH